MGGVNSRLGYIDSIRGIAAISVIYFHIGHEAMLAGNVRPVESRIFFMTTEVLDVGKLAVTLFFMVSGFVIPFSLLRGRQYPLQDFFLSRFFRLYPAYWLSIVAALALYPAFKAGYSVNLATIVANITMLQKFVGFRDIIGVYWTLQIELIFYAICVAMFHFGALGSNIRCFQAGLAATLLGFGLSLGRFAIGKDLPVALGLALATMFFGILWRRHILNGDSEARRYALGLVTMFVAFMPVTAFLAYGADAWLRYTATYYAAFALFILMTTKVKITNEIFVYLGAISYSVYLFGSPVRTVVHYYLGNEIGAPFNVHVNILISCVLTVLLSAAVYRFVERPAVALGRALIGYFEQRRIRVVGAAAEVDS